LDKYDAQAVLTILSKTKGQIIMTAPHHLDLCNVKAKIIDTKNFELKK